MRSLPGPMPARGLVPARAILLSVLSNVKGDDIAYGPWTGDIRGKRRYPACCKPGWILANLGRTCRGGSSSRPAGPSGQAP